MTKVLLALPPNYCFYYDFFPLGTPQLSGYLKSRGVEAVQEDLNLRYLWFCRNKFMKGKSGGSINKTAARVNERMNKHFQKIADKNGKWYAGLLKSDGTVPYGDDTNSSFHFTERMLSSPRLLEYLEDRKENLFLEFYLKEKVLKGIDRQKCGLVGLSVIAPSQALGAFTLGRLIKKRLPNVHVVLGGQWISLFREPIRKHRSLKQCFDTLIYFEGETPLYRLIQALEGKEELEKVPNLIYQKAGKLIYSKNTSREDLNDLAAPDFDGLDLKKYSASQGRGQIGLVYQSARECYWNKCAYCVDLPLPKQGYRERDPRLVVDDLKQLIKKYGLKYAEISNAVISPRQLYSISKIMSEEKVKLKWRAFARIDRGLSLDILKAAKKAGCESLMFGLESANQRVLDFVNKGIRMDSVLPLLKRCREAKMSVSLQMMLGLPSETELEALDTVAFLLKNKKLINDATFNAYYVTPACEVFLNPGKYQLAVEKRKDSPFKFFHKFSRLNGNFTNEQVEALINMYYAKV